VNPNTAMRSFERLQNHNIIYNKRGIGYFISGEAHEKIRQMRQIQFMEEVLPSVFKEMQLLGIETKELIKAYESFNKQTS
jgi:DNA-binding transcriptional regulator YhcF (GntR family)